MPLAWVALAFVGACSAPPTPATEVPAPTAQPQQATPAPAAEPAKKPGLAVARAREVTTQIIAEVAAARALEITREVAVEVRDRDALRAFAKNSMYEHHSREEIQKFGRLDAALGVLRPGVDAETVLLDMIKDSVMGIYDPKQKALLIGAHVSEGQLAMVVGHEIAHGLQDMHFDLKSMQLPIRGQTDAETARTMLVEGDAQASYLAWVAGDEGLARIGDDVLEATNNLTLEIPASVDHAILRRSLQMPYAFGTATVVRLARQDGWQAVDKLYQQLPQTSEQMLHLDKLRAREPAMVVEPDIEAMLGVFPNFEAIWQDTIGEASLLAMLAEVEPSVAARDHAAGWGGDRYVALDRRDHRAMVPMIVGALAWDTVADAEAFEPAFRTYLDRQMPEQYLVERRGATVVYVLRIPDPATRANIAPNLTKLFRVRS